MKIRLLTLWIARSPQRRQNWKDASRAEPALRQASTSLQMRFMTWARQGMKLCRPRNRIRGLMRQSSSQLRGITLPTMEPSATVFMPSFSRNMMIETP
jgi:hypothetical protein